MIKWRNQERHLAFRTPLSFHTPLQEISTVLRIFGKPDAKGENPDDRIKRMELLEVEDEPKIRGD